MSLEKISKTSIWENAFIPKKNDAFIMEKDRLKQAFLSFRNKAIDIVNQISKTVPELTIHDITHLDSLWQTASLICGKAYEINPLEAFVLGGSILLHDAALCFEAYNDGLNGVRNTVIWKDIYASLVNLDNEENRKELADFSALRALHADQAAKLIDFAWKLPDNDSPIYLIDDPTIRIHLGRLIGKIASSHHWDLDKLPSLGTQLNSIQGFPSDWRINPLKIACILRCADAAHICGDRAPDFLYALLKRNSVSFGHWQSQNRLTGPDIDASDQTHSTLMYTSTRPFQEQESKSWWIAYDLISLVDQEIKASNELLELHNCQSSIFQIKQVKGAKSITSLQKYVQAEGWNPIDSKIHVSNIEKLVTNLGGEQLYGTNSDQTKFEIAVRELIQNSRDSIHARLNLNPNFTGKILVKVKSEGDHYVLIVEDNGLGMSQRVLTGPLLDFGSSFWSSSLIHSEFPGLASSKFKAVGRFGIGFYSVFMIADKVSVASKPWQQGLDRTMQLIFNDGLSLRPLFKPSPPAEFDFAVNCQVKLVLKKGILDESLTFKTIDQTIQKQTFQVPIPDYLARLCAGLDVDLYFSDGHAETKVHTSILSEQFDVKSWLHRISFSELQPTTLTKDIIDRNYINIRGIKDSELSYGLAAFNLEGGDFIGVHTVGGFSINPLHKASNYHLGYLELKVNSAKRDGGDIAAPDELMNSWAQDQLDVIDHQRLDILANAILVDLLCKYGISPIPYATIVVKQIGGNFTLTNFMSLLSFVTDRNNRIAIFVVSEFNFAETQSIPDSYESCLIIQPLTRGNFYNYKFVNGEPEEGFNIFSLLHREAVLLGKKPIWVFQQTDIKSMVYQLNLDAIIFSLEDCSDSESETES